MSARTVAVVAALLLIAGVAGATAFLAARPQEGAPRRASSTHAAWTQATWPFATDEWGEGWAYQCKAADCGTDVSLYLRPKIGFCNCQTGVADDPELDRVGDVELIGDTWSALGPGRPITVQWMKGRSRGYRAGARSDRPVLSLAFNDRCDVIVATVVADDDVLAQEPAVLEFLNGDLMRHWAETMLGR